MENCNICMISKYLRRNIKHNFSEYAQVVSGMGGPTKIPVPGILLNSHSEFSVMLALVSSDCLTVSV